MGMSVLDEKMKTVARLVDGNVISDQNLLEVCIKGTVLGFPITLESIKATWPFGVTYIVETRIVDDPNQPKRSDMLFLTLSPRHARGILKPLARLLLLEVKGQLLGNRQVDSTFISSFNNKSEAERFLRYPGVFETILRLERHTKFSELIVNASAGLSLSQPKSFNALDLDVCKETCKMLADLGQVLFESF